MRTSKIIGIIICILIPLIITSFIAYYAYTDPDSIMGNQSKWEEYYLEHEFGNTTKEKLESYVELNSNLYDTAPVINFTDSNNNFKLIGFRYVVKDSNTCTYTFFLYGIDFNQLNIEDASDLSVQYAFEKIDLRDIPEDKKTNATVSRFIEFEDLEATPKVTEDDTDEDKKEYAYYWTYSSTAGIDEDKTLTFKINIVDAGGNETLIFDEAEMIGKGYQISDIIRSSTEFARRMEQEGSTIKTGLNGETNNIGKGYTAFIFPTVLWISAVALVISGGMSYLFYMIWTSEETDPKKSQVKKAKR